jgi:predicted ATP-dependent endonuclease of OLD family
MRLNHARIQGFRCIADCELHVDPQMTALAGASESGKSSILRALSRFSEGGEFTAAEHCSWLQHVSGDDPIVTLTFVLDDQDQERLSAIHSELSTAAEITVARLRNGKHQLVQPLLDVRVGERPPAGLEAALRALRRRVYRLGTDLEAAQADIPEALRDSLPPLASFRQLGRRLRAYPTEDETREALTRVIDLVLQVQVPVQSLARNWTGPKTRRTRIERDATGLLRSLLYERHDLPAIDLAALIALLPPLRLITDDDVPGLPDDIPLARLRSEAGDHVVLRGLLKLAGLEVPSLDAGSDRERRQRLETGSARASNELARLWIQENVRVSLNLVGSNLQIDLIGSEGHRGSPSDHSPGFLWFLRFVLSHLAFERSSTSTGILLLDEPGLHLHIVAQVDLVKQLENSGLQIIYATHSPYMISKNWPGRVRAIQKSGSTSEEPGTKVIHKPYRVEKSRGWEPIRSALGLCAGLSPFTMGTNLLVEGVSDQTILTSCVQTLNRLGRTVPLDLDRTAVCFGGGAASVVPLAQYCHGEEVHWLALFDADVEGRGAAKKLRNAGYPEVHVVVLDEVEGLSGRIDTESLLPEHLYHERVLEAYKRVREHPASSQMPPSYKDMVTDLLKEHDKKDSPIGRSKAYERYFRMKEDWGDFDKVLVSEELARWLGSVEQEDLGSALDDVFILLAAIAERLGAMARS